MPAYSKPPLPSETEKLIWEGWASTPSSPSSAFEVRVVAVVEDDEAGVDPVGPVRGVDPDRVGVAAEPPPAS